MEERIKKDMEVKTACRRILGMNLRYASAELVLCNDFINKRRVLTAAEKDCILSSMLFNPDEKAAFEAYLDTAKGGRLPMPYIDYLKLPKEEKKTIAKKFIKVKDKVKLAPIALVALFIGLLGWLLLGRR